MNLRTVLYCIVTIGVCLSLAGQAFATTVLGPKDCIIENGRKYTSSYGFTADPDAPSKIIITKFSGSADYKGGRLHLNDKVYRLKRFLRGDKMVVERDIELKELNTLRLVFTGEIGAALSVEVTQELPPTASLTSSPEVILRGESSELSWTTENSDECYLTPDIGSVDCNGSLLVEPSGTTEYTLTAVNTALGLEAVSSTTVGVTIAVPSATLTAEPDQVERGQSSILAWTSTDADNCDITPEIGQVECSGAMEVTPLNPVNYIFTARNTASGTMHAATATIQVRITMPTASLSATPAEIKLGQSSTLTWSSTGADVCSITPDIGSVDCNGAMEVAPLGNTLYFFKAENSMSETISIASASVEVNAVVVLPTAALTAEPAEIDRGQSTTLTWTSTNADDCDITPDIGQVECNGSTEVTPLYPTNYIFTARNTASGTRGAAFTTVQVRLIMPTASLSAAPVEIESGQSSTLTWSSTDADDCSITPGIGTVECNGSMEVTPLGNTNYILSAKNSSSGTGVLSMAQVTVQAP